MLLIELFVMQDCKVQHPLKQIQIIFHLWQYIKTMLIIIEKLKKLVGSLIIYNKINYRMYLKIVTVLAQSNEKLYSTCYVKLDLILLPLIQLKGLFNVQINAAKFVCCMQMRALILSCLIIWDGNFVHMQLARK